MNDTLHLVCLSIAVAAGLFFCGVSSAAKRDSRLADIPRWTLDLIALVGVLAVVWAVLGLTLIYRSAHLTSDFAYVLGHSKTLCGGVVIGLVLAWWMSGQMTPFLKKRPRA